MKIIFKKPYLYWTFGIFFGYFLLNAYLSDFFYDMKFIGYYLETINWGKFVISVSLSVLIAALVAANAVYLYIRYKEHKNLKVEGTLACAGTFGGLATGVCSICAAGILPFMLDLMGISFTFGTLPLKGIEIQILTAALLFAGLWGKKK